MKTSNDLSRREFHRRVGAGMLWAGLGSALAGELGLTAAHAGEVGEEGTLSFGALEPLVGFLQNTPLEKLQGLVVEKLNKREVSLEDLLQAAALANARSFAGEDYIGMHTLMAMTPVHHMARQLPSDRRALVVLKILHRNTAQMQAQGSNHKLQPVAPGGEASVALLREAVHGEDLAKAEAIFAKLAQGSAQDAFNDLLHVVEEGMDVHRVVFAHRSWEILDLAGMENAEVMLRQSLRYCVRGEKRSAEHHVIARAILPKLLDEHKLLDKALGTRRMEDAWIDSFSQALFAATPEEAAGAVAEALAEGIAPSEIGESLSLVTNQLVLRDAGRSGKEVRPGKPEGSVHGDSIGVHASDAAHAWRGISEVSDHRNAVACLILSGYQAARDRTQRGGSFTEWQPRPHETQLAGIKATDAEGLLRELEGAIGEQDQGMACALVHRLGSSGGDPQGVIDVLLRHATRVDGALHAEKYFLTSTSNFAATRPAFRWRHLVGLARVTASESATVAAGYEEACALLGVEG